MLNIFFPEENGEEGEREGGEKEGGGVSSRWRKDSGIPYSEPGHIFTTITKKTTIDSYLFWIF